MIRRWCARARALVSLLSALAALACHPIGAPNLVLVSLDSARADRLLGARRTAGTPALAALAERGTVFARAFASSPLSLPSHATLLTGLDPRLHGVRDEGRFVARASLDTVAERLVARGYATAAFVGGLALHHLFGLDQGFAVYDDAIPPPLDAFHFESAGRPARAVTDAALAWLDAGGRDPFFVWVHYHDLHEPGRSSGARQRAARYDEALAAVDGELARLLAGIERASGSRETLIVLVGAHGESLEGDREASHGLLAHDATLHVPLVAVGPGFAAEARSDAFVRCEDVAPTLLAAAGAGEDARAGRGPGAGRPLQDRAPAPEDDERAVWLETLHPEIALGWARITGVRTARWKLLAEPPPAALYDLRADPGETRDRSGSEPEVARRLAARHAALREAAGPPAALDAAERIVRTERFGFLPGPGPAVTPPPDPQGAADALGFVGRAAALAARGRLGDAIQSLGVLSRSPALRAPALRRLAAVHLLAGETGDALRAARALEEATGDAHARVSLALALLADGRAAESLALLDEVEAGEGALSSRGLFVRGQAALQLGRLAAAERAAETLLERLPGDDAVLALASAARSARAGSAAEVERLRAELARSPEAPLVQTRLALARLLVEAGRDDEAAAVLDEAPRPHAELWIARARIAARRGDPRHAVALYERALEAQPTAQHVLPALAALYEQLGRRDDALQVHDRLVRQHPDDARVLAARGAARMRAGRGAEAERDLVRSLELDEAQPRAWTALAGLALGAGREEEAERHLLRALALQPDLAEAHLQLARLYHRRGDPRSALHAERAAAAGAGTPGADPRADRAHADPGEDPRPRRSSD